MRFCIRMFGGCPDYAPALECSPEDKETLVAISKSRHEELRIVERARIIVASLEGKQIQQVAREWGVSIPTVDKWRRRFSLFGLMGSAAEWQAGPVQCPLSQARRRPAGTNSSAPPVAWGWTRRGEAGGQCVRGVAGLAWGRHLPAKTA
jgi:transposase-like protein